MSQLMVLRVTFALKSPEATQAVSWRIAGRAAAAAFGPQGIARLPQLEELTLHVLHSADVHVFQPRRPLAPHAHGLLGQHIMQHANQAGANAQQLESHAKVASSWPVPAGLPLRGLSLRGLALGHNHLMGPRTLAVCCLSAPPCRRFAILSQFCCVHGSRA